jgi:hypothetical protein
MAGKGLLMRTMYYIHATNGPSSCTYQKLNHEKLRELKKLYILYNIPILLCIDPRKPLGRPRRRWIDNIQMDLSEIGLSVVDWFGLAQDRYRWRALVNSVMNLRVP